MEHSKVRNYLILVNEVRKENELQPLDVVVVPLLITNFPEKLSSTEIRAHLNK